METEPRAPYVILSRHPRAELERMSDRIEAIMHTYLTECERITTGHTAGFDTSLADDLANAADTLRHAARMRTNGTIGPSVPIDWR